MPCRIWLLSLALLAATSTHAGSLADVQIYDRTAGRMLAIHAHEGRLYVAGEPGHRYELRLRNRTDSRLLAVTSVDGVNVLSGQTAAPTQRGYVIAPRERLDVEGWRKSLDEVAAFYFTTLSDSYAARTGRPDNVGVIGVALFRERTHCCADAEQERSAQSAPAASSRDSTAKQESRLGTGHGERESSPARVVDFERASASPSEVIVLHYDSRQRLMARGIVPSSPRLAHGQPQPFPLGFVPDP